MSWAVGYDSNWHRDIGYGVPAYCDHPRCNEEIDRGLANVCCGEEPYGGEGCGLYFCEKHHPYSLDGEKWGCCKRCRDHKPPFKAKPDHPDWIKHKATDPTWAEWRKENATE